MQIAGMILDFWNNYVLCGLVINHEKVRKIDMKLGFFPFYLSKSSTLPLSVVLL